MTLPQLRCVLYRGNEPTPRVTDPRAAFRWMNWMEENAKQTDGAMV